MTYIAYLDEFGHIGPYIARADSRYKESPVFGLAGFVLPAENVRNFGTWFYQRKCQLLDWEIEQSGQSPFTWEKKGAALYTAKNVAKYPELRSFTNRLLNKIADLDGFVFYVGVKKSLPAERHLPNVLYARILLEAIKRIDAFCDQDCSPCDNFVLILDEHDQREALLTDAARSMYNRSAPRRRLVEPPFHVESHRYQTVQAADWISGLVGRLGNYWAEPAEFADHQVFQKYFERRIVAASKRSGIRNPRA